MTDPPPGRELEQPDPFVEFARAGRTAADLALDRGAALIAAGHDGKRAVRCIDLLDALAQAARPAVDSHPPGEARLRALIDYLWDDRGLRGNADDYYDPANSFIDSVLERRRGIPISLAVIYIETARRLQIPLAGVGFPGHFLLSYPCAPAAFIDPFAPQRMMTTRDCARMLTELSGGSLQLQPEHVRVATHREILVRMLTNLKHAHARREELGDAVTASTRILALQPDGAQELRDRALLQVRRGALRQARRDLLTYLELAHAAPDRDDVHALLEKVTQGMRSLN